MKINKTIVVVIFALFSSHAFSALGGAGRSVLKKFNSAKLNYWKRKAHSVSYQFPSARGEELLMAVDSGRIDMVRGLLKGGVSPDTRPNETYRTPLAHAAYKGHTKIVKLLIDNGADVNSSYIYQNPVKVIDGRKHEIAERIEGAPLRFAIMNPLDEYFTVFDGRKKIEIINLLIEAGADINARDKLGTILDHAIFHRTREIIATLLRAGAKPSDHYLREAKEFFKDDPKILTLLNR